MADRELWERLLSVKRLGDDNGSPDRQGGRSEFDRDYDRIVFSSHFRRLKDKTQVFPFSPSDYTRVRLTHTLEVASVGRSLGQLVGKELADRNLLPEGLTASDIGTLVSTACLAHDVGNPPFGHAGEAAIQEWASQHFTEERGVDNQHDFLKFEGNAQSFRIYTRLHARNRRGGTRITYATLGTLMKYPISSTEKAKLGKTENVMYKKFGFFEAEREHFKEVFNYFNQNRSEFKYVRHPLSFLMEAADDICNCVIDIEDGYRQKLLSHTESLNTLRSLFRGKMYDPVKENLSDDEDINYQRAITISGLTEASARKFIENLNQIEAGEFTNDLLSQVVDQTIRNDRDNLGAKKLFTNSRVLSNEIAGFEIIGGLLDILAEAFILSSNKESSKKIRNYLFAAEHPVKNSFDATKTPSIYQKYLAITDYVCGCTDSFALELYQELTGISLR
jgi:dGTPase